MRKITFLILLLVCTLSFAHGNIDDFENDIEVVEILDEYIESSELFCDKDYPVPTELNFPNLKSVEGVFEFCKNKNLVRINAPVLESISDNFIIEHNSDLKEISFPNLKLVGAVAGIVENPMLEEINLSHLKETGMDLAIYANPKLINLDLPSLKTICGGVAFHLNHSIKSIDLPVLQSVGHCGEHIGSFFYIHDNNGLKNVNLPFLEITGSLQISNNMELELVEVPNLVTADMDVHVHNNQKLKELDFQSLKTVQAGLYITSNHSLAILNLCSYPIPNAQFDEEDVPIDNQFYISNNLIVDQPPFCPDTNLGEEEEEEVVEEEDYDESPDAEETRVSIHPNPAEDIVQIDSEIAFDKIEIYDLSGNLIKSFRPNESGYDVSDVAAGMYVMIIYHKDSIYGTIKKLVIR